MILTPEQAFAGVIMVISGVMILKVYRKKIKSKILFLTNSFCDFLAGRSVDNMKKMFQDVDVLTNADLLTRHANLKVEKENVSKMVKKQC